MEKMKSYKIYGLVSCGYCTRLVEHLRTLQIPFYVEFLDWNLKKLEEVKKKYNHKTVPIVIAREVTEDFIGGHDDTMNHLYKDYKAV